MKILCTFPGRHGDILWSLPTLRALYQATGATIDLGVAPKYSGVCELVSRQPYVRCALPIPGWEVEETAPMTPRIPPERALACLGSYDHIFHLGYDVWPMQTLPFETFWRLYGQLPSRIREKMPLPDLSKPWLERFGWIPPTEPTIGVIFTDEWLELKAGILAGLAPRFMRWDRGPHMRDPRFLLILPKTGGRWSGEYGSSFPPNVSIVSSSLYGAVNIMAACDLVVADNSAGHVIACGLGCPVVMVEPAAARHHPIFYPYGQDGPEVTLVKGGDGQPTFDLRHIGDLVDAALRRITRLNLQPREK